MKEFFRSYLELQKLNNVWIKKHWVGYLILTLVVIVIEAFAFGWVTFEMISDYIESKFKKTEPVSDEA